MTTQVWTIGFTQTTAESFFDRLRRSGVKRLMDVRLHNTSQLSGFAKSDDLAFFLREIAGIDYVHLPMLAPLDWMLDEYKKNKGDWSVYERRFTDLMASRRIEDELSIDDMDNSCLLCSEAKPHHCHRRLVVEYLNARWGGGLSVRHI